MSVEQNHNPNRFESKWQPSCSLSALKARAELYALIRDFFAQRGVLEVETPLLSRSSASDPHLESIMASVRYQMSSEFSQCYLHTSPEFPMKRLLASGSGPIYQVCKTFRNGETGRRHNPEFSMLEWYRPGFRLSELMSEVKALITLVLGSDKYQSLTYRNAFLQYLGIDPFEVTIEDLEVSARKLAAYEGPSLERDDYLNMLLSVGIEPHLGKEQPVFLSEYPASQASLAQTCISESGHHVAQRFELYFQGIELANGYFELTDADEQLKRFEQDNLARRNLQLPVIPPDENLVSALKHGLPSSSGVALGLDRLLMIKLGASSISEVLAFPIDRA